LKVSYTGEFEDGVGYLSSSNCVSVEYTATDGAWNEGFLATFGCGLSIIRPYIKLY